MARSKGQPKFVQPVRKYTNWLGCLLHIHRELGRLGRTEDSLNYYQKQMLSNLRNPWDEQAISHLHKWWQYDTEALIKRGCHQEPALPRIEIKFWINSRDNFILEWQPTHTLYGRPSKGCDWKDWYRVDPYFGKRASNELMYIKSVGDAVNNIELNQASPEEQFIRDRPGWREKIKTSRTYRWEDHAIDSILLSALSSAVDYLRDRLRRNFEVKMINEIVAMWEADKQPRKEGTYYPIQPHRLVSWSIENVEERVKTEERAELEKLKAVCPLEVFAGAWGEADARKWTGPPASASTKDLRVSRLLKKRGHSTLTPSVVRRYEYLLNRFQPGALPCAAPDPSKVVPFKRDET
jgi:hypothetical protein